MQREKDLIRRGMDKAGQLGDQAYDMAQAIKDSILDSEIEDVINKLTQPEIFNDFEARCLALSLCNWTLVTLDFETHGHKYSTPVGFRLENPPKRVEALIHTSSLNVSIEGFVGYLAHAHEYLDTLAGNDNYTHEQLAECVKHLDEGKTYSLKKDTQEQYFLGDAVAAKRVAIQQAKIEESKQKEKEARRRQRSEEIE